MSEQAFPRPGSWRVHLLVLLQDSGEHFTQGAAIKITQTDGGFTVTVLPKDGGPVSFSDLKVQGNTLVRMAEEPGFVIGLVRRGADRGLLCGVLLRGSDRGDVPTGVWTAEEDTVDSTEYPPA